MRESVVGVGDVDLLKSTTGDRAQLAEGLFLVDTHGVEPKGCYPAGTDIYTAVPGIGPTY
eukprot:COSAG01_NODE_3648_length_5827_cov_4.766934_7_plen_60_part_00